VAQEYESSGHRPWTLYSSFHPLGAAGFVDCALELHQQLREAEIHVDRVYVTSAGATQVGLALGSTFLEAPYPVTGFAYTATTDHSSTRMLELGRQTAELLQLEVKLEESDLASVSCGGAGYGIPTREGQEAIKILAETEGIFLDPVYTGKGMGGLITQIRSGHIPSNETVVFVHTGGTAALFAYSQEVLTSLAES